MPWYIIMQILIKNQVIRYFSSKVIVSQSFVELFISSELKVQVSFSDRLSSVVCLVVILYARLSVNCSSSSAEPLNLFQPNLGQCPLPWGDKKNNKAFLCKEDSNHSNEETRPFLKGDSNDLR